uniref:Uncharacterized protein n=1 Tax=Lepeophtheirus salmonis TaxID=72036 RepID=A0A0K2TVH1_LEPSM
MGFYLSLIVYNTLEISAIAELNFTILTNFSNLTFTNRSECPLLWVSVRLFTRICLIIASCRLVMFDR